MKSKKIIEFYINNKLYKTCSYNKWDTTSDYIKNLLHKGGFHYVWSDYFSREIPDEGKVYVNPVKFKTIVLSYKIFSGYKDKKGNKLYHGDTVLTPYGFNSRLYQHWNEDTYYVRHNHEKSWCWTDYTIENFNDFEKIQDVNELPKKYWNNPQTINLKDI